ncbi:MAG: LytTR family DNA-binding domain-containing protein [Saprospiraceae bacterium]|nr:LytTR family DNA-binding domain-containing protein [Saprospiraceae bacterium]MCF8249457.1 LytTR family DNA-binding domain-containing protein [Saprospiraceae bacterium]MCF8279111.1 LytTR family DNA-binding domain-containing protein [Bacteroidales bacterium]MCF8311586.1 LytTR family DNA-binding domain-containing protein [Saprospiraceae bacterium]MCF8440076.1 LytTR family DNA-binding domain-containing protein [Saprospiraceae bacterium]
MKIRCIAVDDEPLSLRIIQKYAADLPHLDLLATCDNAFDAMDFLRQNPVDLMLLDINMPKLSGISLLKALDTKPLVVFTTAYSEYAVEGFELEAVDYLLKPFSLERFVKAVNRAADKLEPQKGKQETLPDFLLVKADRKLYKVDFQDIARLEAYGDYVKIFTKDKMLLTKERLNIVEQQLPPALFTRIHRSHIIALAAIEFIEGNLVKIGDEKLPISENLRELLLEKLNRQG